MNVQNDLLLRAASGEATERPPVWLMRQAGRILPEYRALRASLSGFKELVQTPALAAEVTVQPVDALDVDAAILFSDILVIPEAMGLDYELVEKKGPRFPVTITSKRQIDALLQGAVAADRLSYVYEAISLTREKLAGRVPLIGFAGAPWTLLAYMVEGGGSKTFSKAKRFLYQEPNLAHTLLDKLTQTIIAYLHRKVEAGVQLVQVFDSWAGLLSEDLYREFGLPYLQQICDSIQEVPLTLFAKGAWFSLEALGQLDCQVVGLDWNISPAFARQVLGPDRVIQGNLDPCLLYADPAQIQASTLENIQAFKGHQIVNLGHGVYPDTPVEHVQALVQTVKTFRYESA